MLDVNTSMMTQYLHQLHPLHSFKDANGNIRPTRGGGPAYNYAMFLPKHQPPLNAYVRTPDTFYPMSSTTQTGFWSVGVKYGTQTSFHSHPAPIAQTNGRRHSIGSLNIPTSSRVGKSEMMPYYSEAVGGHRWFCETPPNSGSGSTDRNVLKPTHPSRRVGSLKRSRSQPMTDNQLWSDIDQAESLHKSLRVDKVDPPSPYAPSNKLKASRNQQVQPTSKTLVELLKKNHLRQSEADSVPKKGRNRRCLKKSSTLKKEHLKTSKSETHPLFVSQQGPLAEQKITMTTTGMSTNISKLTCTPMHLLNNVFTAQLADNEPRTELQRRQGRQMPYSQRKLGYTPKNSAVRVGNNPTFYQKDKHVIQLTQNLPKITTRAGPMTSAKSEVHHLLTHPYSIMQPCSDSIKVLYHTQTFNEGPRSHPQLYRASSLPSFPVKDGLHGANDKFVNPLQSNHDKIRQKLRYEIKCKRMAMRQQRPNHFEARHSRSFPVSHHPSTSLEDIYTQSNDKSSYVVHPYSTSRKQGDASTIPMSTLNRRPKKTQKGNMSSFKSQQNNTFSVSTNSSVSKRGDPFADFSMINKHHTLKEGANTGIQTGEKLGPSDCNFIPCRPDKKQEIHSNHPYREKSVKDEQKLVGENSINITRKNGPGGKKDAQHTMNSLSTIRHGIGPNGYVSQITYGEFLKDIVVPMTLAVSNKDKKNQEKFASLVNFWQNQADQFQSDSPSTRKFTAEETDRTIPIGQGKQSNNSSISDRPSNVAKAEDLRALLLIEGTINSKRASRGDSINEEETEGFVKDVGHENQNTLEAQTIRSWDERITSTTSSTLPDNTASITEKDLSIEGTHPTENNDEESSSISQTPRTRRASRDDSINEEETEGFVKDVGHENQNTLEAQTIRSWDERITSTTSSTLPDNTASITKKNLSIKGTHPTENNDEESSSISQTPRIKSVRVVLRTSDRIRMKFYNVGSSLPAQPKEIREKKRKRKRRKDVKKKKILMRIGSETLFTRSLYCSSISPRKHIARRKKKKVKQKTKTLSPPPKDFNRIALSVHKHEGETILHRAVRVNAKEVLLYCLGNNIGEVNAKDNAGYTPLHECCVFDKVWMAEKLILHGADVNASAHDGTRPIHDAVENHRADMTRLLLSHGADPLLPTYAKRTALDNATSFEIVTLLHEYLRDINGESEELLRKLKSSNINRRTLRFKSSISTQENDKWTDNFFDTSELIENAEEEQDAILYLKEIPQPKHIRLKLKENEMVKTWYLLSDVLARLKIPAATFPYLYPHIKVNGLPTSIFLKKIERVSALNQFDFAAICGERELVEFVEADDEMCSILQLEGWIAMMQ